MKKIKKIILCLCLLICAVALTIGLRYYLQFKEREKKYDALIIETAARHDVPPSLVKAVIYQESRFREGVRGSHGEYGLMQITTLAADDWIRKNRKMEFGNYDQLFTPELNIEIGTWYLSKGLTKYKDYKEKTALALAHYNAGPGNVIKKKWVPSHKDGDVLKLITFPSTKSYVKNILRYEKEYQQKGFDQ